MKGAAADDLNGQKDDSQVGLIGPKSPEKRSLDIRNKNALLVRTLERDLPARDGLSKITHSGQSLAIVIKLCSLSLFW